MTSGVPGHAGAIAFPGHAGRSALLAGARSLDAGLALARSHHRQGPPVNITDQETVDRQHGAGAAGTADRSHALAPPHPRADRRRLLGPAAPLAGDLARRARHHGGIAGDARELVLGIDFAGGVAWDVPAENLTTEEAEAILEENGLSANSAKIQERASDSGDLIKIQVEDQPTEVRVRLQEAFAEAAGVDPAAVSVESVSASWGEDITRKALIALVVFLGLIALYISLRFEWRMALTAILAMLHDVAISVGIYSVFGFEVTPATVVAFLTVLGLLALRQHRRVRPHQGQREAHRLRRSDGRRPDQRVDQPGAAAIGEHHDRRRTARALPPRRRLVDLRPGHAA